MSSTPLNTGVLPTSTPVHSPLSDSGFFSCDKVPWDGKFDTLSPIVEISNFQRVNEIAESPYTYFDGYRVARELTFSNSLDFAGNSLNSNTCEIDGNEISSQNSFPSFNLSLSKEEEKIVLKREPSDADGQFCADDFDQNVNYVNRTVSSCHDDSSKNLFVNLKTSLKPRSRVDFFKGFEERNLYGIASFLLSVLREEDLCRVCCVSKKWRKMVQQDVKANCRRKAFLKEKYSQKENHCHLPPSSEIGLIENCNLHEGEHKTALFNMGNFAATSKQPLKQQVMTRFESFVKQAAATLGQAALMKCPECKYAAKNHIPNVCVCTKCNYAFCQRCLGPYLKTHICSKSKKVSVVVGSKQSKRNLKRL